MAEGGEAGLAVAYSLKGGVLADEGGVLADEGGVLADEGGAGAGDRRGRGRGLDAYQREQGVVAALSSGAGVGVVAAAVGPVQAVG